MDATSLLVPGSEDGLRAARAGLEAFAAARGLSPSAIWPFQVALDEVLSNVVRHGTGRAPVEVVLRLQGGLLEMQITDDSAPFDPLAAREPDTAAPLEARAVGGLGITLVRRLMDVVEYERVADRNRLRLRRRVSSGGVDGMEIVEESRNGIVAVAAKGRLDSTTSPDLEKHLLGLVDGGARRLVVDLKDIEYVSSAGLRVLLLLAKRLKVAPGDLVLCGLSPAVRQVFDLAGFVPLFRLEPSREDAFARLSSGG